MDIKDNPLERENFKKNARTDMKERLREKCLLKLRQIRAQLLEKRRNSSNNNCYKTTLQEVVKEEIKNKELTEEEFIDLCLSIEEEIEQELRLEEEGILKAYEEQEIYEMEELEHYKKELFSIQDPHFVICPSCQSNRLFSTKHSIFCKCGLRINTQV